MNVHPLITMYSFSAPMTASGFRAFFPPNSNAMPTVPSNLQHLIPNMRFLAQKLENPGGGAFPGFPGLPSQPQPPPVLGTTGNPGRPMIPDDDIEEVSTSNSFNTDGAGLGHTPDHGPDSGKNF